MIQSRLPVGKHYECFVQLDMYNIIPRYHIIIVTDNISSMMHHIYHTYDHNISYRLPGKKLKQYYNFSTIGRFVIFSNSFLLQII